MTHLALVVDDVRQRHWLENQLVKASHYVLLSCSADELEAVHGGLEEEPQIWLVLLSAKRIERALGYISAVSSAPTLVLDDWPGERDHLVRWYTQLLGKLDAALLPRSAPSEVAELEQVWLLGASLGGPEAVTEFLAAVPVSLPVGFVYVQHIEEAFDKALSTQLQRKTPHNIAMFTGEARLRAGQVLIIAPETKPRFLPFGRVIASSKGWRSGYRPCIDEVAEGLVAQYRNRLGLLIFTGTCNDGEQAALRVRQAGGQVWTQAIETCVSDTMPEAVNRTGVVSVSGTPAQLAATLSSRLRGKAKK
ncbi:chemosensory pili system protein ChpB (putative protein-glutamate methylesterase) [Litorivivens lipolytica]|uniref:protein-glutamate methylesterase n=1 Tax=Litorivivens lipolytica TaxID=1524264 RepID=A0A7W4W7R2_9GAMM|nr:chemotaxis protein CheB [Litorivivens lipolytica]MBB3048402.1 chemosensory pili system protein ChpB (putative protein-glutamate methylesterase) [Litorivivens lipolytica]